MSDHSTFIFVHYLERGAVFSVQSEMFSEKVHLIGVPGLRELTHPCHFLHTAALLSHQKRSKNNQDIMKCVMGSGLTEVVLGSQVQYSAPA